MPMLLLKVWYEGSTVDESKLELDIWPSLTTDVAQLRDRSFIVRHGTRIEHVQILADDGLVAVSVYDTDVQSERLKDHVHIRAKGTQGQYSLVVGQPVLSITGSIVALASYTESPQIVLLPLDILFGDRPFVGGCRCGDLHLKCASSESFFLPIEGQTVLQADPHLGTIRVRSSSNDERFGWRRHFDGASLVYAQGPDLLCVCQWVKDDFVKVWWSSAAMATLRADIAQWRGELQRLTTDFLAMRLRWVEFLNPLLSGGTVDCQQLRSRLQALRRQRELVWAHRRTGIRQRTLTGHCVERVPAGARVCLSSDVEFAWFWPPAAPPAGVSTQPVMRAFTCHWPQHGAGQNHH